VKKDYTHIVIVLDQSGSMGIIKDAMEEGLAALLEENRKVDLPCTVSVYKFDAVVELAHNFADLRELSKITLKPRGSTALNDALCLAIDETGSALANKTEADRPERVLFMVITDGMENSSIRHSRRDVRDRVEHQEAKYGWKFVYLGANQDAVKVGEALGVKTNATYNATPAGSHHTHEIGAGKMAAYRSSGVYTNYSAEEQARMQQ
jgi:uncharacterized protein YegL